MLEGRRRFEPHVEASAPCTNEFANENAPPAAAPEPAPADAAFRTNEFPAPAPPPPEEPRGDTVTLLSTYRTLKKESATEAWAWLNELTAEDMETDPGGVRQRAGQAAGQGGRGADCRALRDERAKLLSATAGFPSDRSGAGGEATSRDLSRAAVPVGRLQETRREHRP